MKKILLVFSILILLTPLIAYAHDESNPAAAEVGTQRGLTDAERIYRTSDTSVTNLLRIAFTKTIEWSGLPLAASLVVSTISFLFAIISLLMRKTHVAFSFGLAGLLGWSAAAWAKIDPSIRLFDMIDTVLVPMSLIGNVLIGIFALLVAYGFYFIVKRWRASEDIKAIAVLAVSIILSLSLLGISYTLIPFVRDTGVREHPQGIPVTNRAIAVPIAENLSFPTWLAIDSKGSIYFGEFRTGLIGVLEPNGDGTFKKSEFAHIEIPEKAWLEQGLWGLALNPDEKYLYAMAVDKIYNDDRNAFSHVIRFNIENGKGTNMEEIITGLPSHGFHNGGAMAFGPDGKLYVTVGDIGEEETARDPRFLNAKVLRFNPDGSVPTDGPYPRSPVYASGLRNVYGLAFHPETKLLYATVNGPECCDRISLIKRGGDYGWPTYGKKPTDVELMKKDSSVMPPIRDYGFARTAPTQMLFLNSKLYGDEFYNNIIYGTWSTAAVHRAVLSDHGDEIIWEEIILVVEKEARKEYIPAIPGGVNAVAMDKDGNLYVATTSKILKITEIKPMEKK